MRYMTEFLLAERNTEEGLRNAKSDRNFLGIMVGQTTQSWYKKIYLICMSYPMRYMTKLL